MKSIDQLNIFVKVAQEQSFSRVAKDLKISTARVSRQVSDLEASLGVVLLRRTTRQVALTQAGEKYYKQVRETLEKLDEAEAILSAAQREPQGLLTVCTNPFMNQNYLLPYLPQFLARYPKLTLKLKVEERAIEIPKEPIDVYYGTVLPGPADWLQKRLFDSRYGLYAAPKYLKKFGTPKKPSDLKSHRFITHMYRPEPLSLELGKHEIALEPYIITDHSYSMLQCILNGLGFAKLLQDCVQEELQQGRLIEILPEYLGKEKRPLYLYYPSSRYLQPKVRAFVDFFSALNFPKK